MTSELSLAEAELRNKVSPFNPGGGAVGAFTAHIVDILGCGGQDVPPITETFVEALWGIAAKEIVVCVRGNGTAPGERLLSASDPVRFLVQVGSPESSPALWAAR